MAHVLLLHLDGKMPNLALMRLAAYHRALGDRVDLRQVASAADLQPRLGDPTWGHVYGSLIFERTRPLAVAAQAAYPKLELGGTGWDFEGGVQIRNTKLPAGAEELTPDYSVYPWFEHSIGFAQRGCRFSCSFCVVPRKEGKVRSVGSLETIWRGPPHPARLVLLDNDFFGNPQWRDVIAHAQRLDIAIAVIQGINARLLSDEQAAAIASVRWMADDFSRRRVYTAWDNEDDERTFFRGLDRLKAHGIKPGAILVYMLIGHADGETHAARDYRRAKLREFGAMPYPMPFVRDGDLGAELVAFQRWCIQRADLHVPWDRWWGKARGELRRLSAQKRRVSLPLFQDDSEEE
jgi:hypothetical protein